MANHRLPVRRSVNAASKPERSRHQRAEYGFASILKVRWPRRNSDSTIAAGQNPIPDPEADCKYPRNAELLEKSPPGECRARRGARISRLLAP